MSMKELVEAADESKVLKKKIQRVLQIVENDQSWHWADKDTREKIRNILE